MKITKIRIRNLFGISEHEADGKSVELVGVNGAGKSSVLDAIKYALTNASDREYIIKNGAEEGEIYVETDTGLSIERKARTGRSDYKSIKEQGVPVASPESFLRQIFTPLQLEPMEFIRMDKKEQNATILNMIKYDWNLDSIIAWFGEIVPDVNYEQNIISVLNDIQAENGHYFRLRQDINRSIREKRAIVTDIGSSLPMEYDGDYWEKQSLSDIYSEIESIRKENANIEKAKALAASHDSRMRSFLADKELKLAALENEISSSRTGIERELASLRERIASLEEKKAGLENVKADRARVIQADYEAEVARFEQQVGAVEEYKDMEERPVAELVEKAEYMERMKGHINEWRRMSGIQKEIEELSVKSQKLTSKIELARELPGKILEDAVLPVEGLTIKDGIPLIHGLPVSNLSEGEKLDLCIDVAVQNPSGLQIILIDGMEKLSEANRNRLYDKCRKKGLQFISTRTTDDGQLTVIEL